MTAKKSSGRESEAALELVDAEVELPSTWQERTIERRLSSRESSCSGSQFEVSCRRARVGRGDRAS